VKSRHARTRAYFKTLREAEMPAVYQAVNALQRTPWRINRAVLETLDELWRMHLEVAGLPPQEEKPLPEKLDWMTEAYKLPKEERAKPDEYQELELKAWKQAASRIYLANAQRLSHVIAAVKIRGVAREFVEEATIYFPHQLDWRGRVYAVPLFLQPQGADMARGLLEFAEGKPFGTAEAINWWKIHGSNSWGFDKAPFADRVAWVDDHAEEILAAAADPASERWWCEADEPWQFLAFCLEFARWLECVKEGHSREFVSHLPVSMDGSCNGLQHLSALMRDEQGAEATNLLPSERPQDIYARVCQRVEVAVLRDSQLAPIPSDPKRMQTISLARQWLKSGLLTRDVVKRQVMTRPYGATLRGMFEQLSEHLVKVEHKLPAGLPFEEESGWAACKYLTPLIWAAINEVVTGAQVCMEWLQACARVLTKSDQPLRWQTPTGFPVEQAYLKTTLRRIDTILLGTRYQLKVREEVPDTLDGRKQTAGVSPNYIHSMDGAHMQLTMEGMVERQVSWAMVHDSFGCHAADAPHLAVTLRSTFVSLYQDGQALARWRAEVGAECPDGLPEVPVPGSLDLEAVREAMFFFA
jgi:DNA-directed RNA polymerase